MIMCKAFSAQPHKASFDANKPNERFAVLNRNIME